MLTKKELDEFVAKAVKNKSNALTLLTMMNYLKMLSKSWEKFFDLYHSQFKEIVKNEKWDVIEIKNK
jgi:hypothetical protein